MVIVVFQYGNIALPILVIMVIAGISIWKYCPSTWNYNGNYNVSVWKYSIPILEILLLELKW